MRECSPPPRVTYQVSHVTCHVSHVKCHMSHVKICLSSDKMVELVGRGFVINVAYPVYFFYVVIFALYNNETPGQIYRKY